MPVLASIAARARWSHMVKRSDAEASKMENEIEKKIISELATEMIATNSAELRRAHTTLDDPCSERRGRYIDAGRRDHKPN